MTCAVYLLCLYITERSYLHREPPPPHTRCDEMMADGFDGGAGDSGGNHDDAHSESSASPGQSRAPFLEKLHELVQEYVGADCVDGDVADLRFIAEAVGGDYAPWPNLTRLLIYVWAILTRPSRKSLQLLLDLLRYRDRNGCTFNPDDLPASSEHLVARGRLLLPLLKVLQRKVTDKDGYESKVLEIPYNLLLQRTLDSPAAVEEILSNPGGHVMSPEERQQNGVPHDHVTPQATNNVDGARGGFMNGKVVRSSNHMSLDCIETSTGHRAFVGDTLMARGGVSAAGGDLTPFRISAIFWQKKTTGERRPLQLPGEDGAAFWEGFRSRADSSGSPSPPSPAPSSSEQDAEEEGEVLVVQLHPLKLARDMPASLKNKRRREHGDEQAAGDPFPSVWEKTNDPVHVRASQLAGPCVVVPYGTNPAPPHGLGEDADTPTYWGEGFVKFTSASGAVDVLRKPWRQTGLEGWFMDRRSGDCYENVDGDPVFSSGLILASDGFNYWSLGGRTFNIDASYVALSCVSSSLLRRLRSWMLVVVGGAKGRWEENMLPLINTIRQLEKGCRARVKTGDGAEQTVSS